jgi:hypothetical protein
MMAVRIGNLDKMQKGVIYGCDVYDGVYDYAIVTEDNLLIYFNNLADGTSVIDLNTGDELYRLDHPRWFKKIVKHYLSEKEFRSLTTGRKSRLPVVYLDWDNFLDWDKCDYGIGYSDTKVASKFFKKLQNTFLQEN